MSVKKSGEIRFTFKNLTWQAILFHIIFLRKSYFSDYLIQDMINNYYIIVYNMLDNNCIMQ